MGDSLDRLGPILLDGAIAATVLLGLTALAMVACGQPARRCFLARVALFGVLLVVPLAVYAPLPRFSLKAPIAFVMPPERKVPVAGAPALWRNLPPGAWSRGLILAALSGTAIGLAAIGVGWLGCWRMLHKTIEPAPETLALYESLPFDSIRRRPRLRVSARVRHPILIGTFCPTILIPPDLDEPDEAEPLRLGLLHELAHAERHDPEFGLIAAIAGAFWFFVPPLWWVRRQARLDQEFLADRGASGRFGPRVSYASSLLGMAESGPGGGMAGGDTAGGSERGAGGSSLFSRVLMLVRCPFPVESRPPRWWRWACLPALACGTVLASGLTVSEDQAAPIPAGSCGHVRRDHGLLQIARLMIEARRAGTDGRVPPYTLLRRLPSRFEMIVEVWADPSDLPRIAIAGRHLGPIPGNPPLTEGYHKVRLVRDDHGLALWVAGHPVPSHSRDQPPPDLLSIQPAPEERGRLRNLVLTW